MGNIQSCSLTLWNSLSLSSALPQEGKMRATDVHKKTWCSSNVSLIFKPSVPLGSCPWQQRRSCAYFCVSIPTYVSPDSTKHQGPCSSSSTSVLHSSHTPAQSTQSYLLLTSLEPEANPESSRFIPLYHPSGSSILALSLISFICECIFFLPSRKSIPGYTVINADWPACG